MKKLMLAALPMAAMLVQAAPEKVVHLSFDQAGELKDLCGHVKVLKAAGDPQWQADGVSGGCLFFDGKTSLRIKKSPYFTFAPDQSFTLEVCYNPEPTGEKNWGTLLMHSARGKGWSLLASGSIGRPMFNGNAPGKMCRLLTPYQVMLKKWCRVAVVRDAAAKRISLYLDGKMLVEADDTMAQTFSTANYDLVIGRGFKGRIDELILWNGVKRDFRPAKEFSEKIVPLPVSPDVADSWKKLKENHLDLVPAPKKLKITGKPFQFKPEEWQVVRTTPADQAGFEVFTGKLNRIGLKTFGKTGKKTIRAGLYDDLLPELKKVKAPAKPIRQGYVLVSSENSILIAGSDLHGLLYGWQTLANLVRENGEMTPATISDWPDFLNRRLEAGVASYPGKYGERIIDSFFLQRANLASLCGQSALRMSRKYPAKRWRELNAYAAARGIRLLLVDKTSVIKLGDDFRKLIPPGYSTHYYPYKPEEGLFGYFDGAYSWSRDDLAEKNGSELGDYLAKTGFGGIGFHSIDCGNYDNPGNWAKRTEMDKKRWGDNRVGAESNLISIFAREIRKKNPGILVGFCQYPYTCVTDPKMIQYQVGLNRELPAEIALVFREAPRPLFLENAKRLASHPILSSNYPYDYSHLPCYTNSGRYAANMYFNQLSGMGFVHWQTATLFHNASDMAASEYLWNAFAPGAAVLPEGKHSFEIVTAKCPEMEEELLPRICRRIYGEKAGDTVARAYSLKLSTRVPEHPDSVLPANIDKDQFFAKMQNDAAEAWKQLKAVRKDVPAAELIMFDQLMSYVKRCELLAAARLHAVRARAELNRGNVEAGKAEAQKGLALTKRREIRTGRIPTWKPIADDLNIAGIIEQRLRRAEYLKTVKPVKVRVALYGYTGSGGVRDLNAGILNGFGNTAGISMTVLRNPTKSNLKKIDVLVFNATKVLGDCDEDPIANIREFVRNGGSVIFAHNAVGRHQGAFQPTWFPEICRGFDATGTNQPELTAQSPDAVAGFLKKGDRYTHRYFDHCRLLPGPKGRVELCDPDGKPVLISGTFGKGRVVYTGEIFGVLPKNDLQAEPELEEWKMLYNLFRWCAGRPNK